MIYCRRFALLTLGFLLTSAMANGQPVVWSGYDFSFSKPNGVSHTLPEFQDQITENVTFTRGNLEGLFNLAEESGFVRFTSPADTRWATAWNNPEATIEASNWENLDFTTWTNSYGGAGNLSTQIVNLDAVVHLEKDDIYLDLRFTQWTEGAGGGFAYNRAMAPVAPGRADFNDDGNIDGLDLEIWETHFGNLDATHGEGDADLDGTVDGRDFLIWQREFTGAPSAIGFAVPEPSAGLLIVAGTVCAAPIHCRRRRALR